MSLFSIQGYLTVSILLFVMGVIAILSRKNLVAVLMGVELVLNASALNFVAFGRFVTASLDAQVFALFIIIIAAAEAAVALAIVLRLYGIRETIDIDRVSDLRE